MFTDELNAIRNAEEQADALKKESKQEANEKALQMIAEAELSAKESYEKLKSEGQQIADAEYDKAIKASIADAEELEKQALLRKDEVVQFIAERIVSLSVNS